MKIKTIEKQGTKYIKVRKSSPKLNYFREQDIDITVNGNYILTEYSQKLALTLLDKQVTANQGNNSSKEFTEISNLLYSQTFKANVSHDTSQEIAKDIKDILKQYYSKDKLKSLITESKRKSQNTAGYRASLSTKLNEYKSEGTTFNDLSELNHKVGSELIRKSELNKKYETYSGINDFKELIEKYFPSLLK